MFRIPYYASGFFLFVTRAPVEVAGHVFARCFAGMVPHGESPLLRHSAKRSGGRVVLVIPTRQVTLLQLVL